MKEERSQALPMGTIEIKAILITESIYSATARKAMVDTESRLEM